MSTQKQSSGRRRAKSSGVKKVVKKAPSPKSTPQKVGVARQTKKAPARGTAASSKRKAPAVTELASTNKLLQKKATVQPVINKSNTERGLLIPSPWRFPIDIDKVAQQTARFAGVFFIVMGALFTLWHANSYLNDLSGSTLSAQIAASSNALEAPSDNQPSNPARVQNSTQTIVFTPSDPIQGEKVLATLPITTVPERVTLRAQNTVTGEVVNVGRLSQAQGNNWETTFDSTVLKDAQYRFVLLAEYTEGQNSHYSVTINDTKEHTIKNGLATKASLIATTSTTSSSTIFATDTGSSSVDSSNIHSEAADSRVVDTNSTESVPVNRLNPHISIVIPGLEALSDFVDIQIDVPEATYTELYAIPTNSATQKYLGLPRQLNPNTWQLTLNTKDVPNGEYRLLAKVRTNYGFFTAESETVEVLNEVSTTTDSTQLEYKRQAEAIAADTQMSTSLWKGFSATDTSVSTAQVGTRNGDLYNARAVLQSRLERYRNDFEKVFQLLATAHRSENEAAIETARFSVTELVDTVKEDEFTNDTDVEMKSELDTYVKEVLDRIPEDIRKTNIVIAERTKIAAQTDTDQDGIPDFDEISFYKTDPEVADSDGDGFDDGIEILQGYNPVESTSETIVAYESPREVGVVREDILAVHSITTEAFPATDEAVAAENPVAIITGKGLPNSFVTVYIFSTPVVATVRTDSDGGWIYRFDKELEEGTHQVYVGITDNTGKIVAKSNPLFFVKEAEAYTQVDQSAPGAIAVSDSVPEESPSTLALLLVASISVVAIGLVLLILGLHMQSRPKLLVRNESA